jgi:NTP pyrophosphatase (non-canonical NTP hydrolase)
MALTTFSEYTELVKLTMGTTNDRLDDNHWTLIWTLGLSGEARETKNAELEENLIEELGDLLWYIHAISSKLNLTIVETPSIGSNVSFVSRHMFIESINYKENLLDSCVEFGEFYKKVVRDNRPMIDNKNKLEAMMSTILDLVICIAIQKNLSVSDICQKNADKLLNRYPTGFDAQRSINR